MYSFHITISVLVVYKPLFAPRISYMDILSMKSSISRITISNWACNDSHCIIFDLSRFIKVKSIEIGDDCFGSVQIFRIDGLNRLKTIKIGNNSFTQNKIDFGNDKSKSFHILNCGSLESIEIGEWSFIDFGGDFELTNLPQLQSIQIGTIGNNSYNFHGSSFIIHGMELMLYI